VIPEQDVIPQEEVDLSDDETPFDQDQSEFRSAGGIFAEVPGTGDLDSWTPPVGMKTIPIIHKIDPDINVQRRVPELDKILGRASAQELPTQPESEEESPPCPLDRDEVRVGDFRVIKTMPNRAEMIFSRGN
jgi:hypothetical protein